MALGQERDPTTVIIGIGELPAPAGNASARAAEMSRREREPETLIEGLLSEWYPIF